MNSGYKVGDRIVCSANGNPKPSYKWMDTETNITIHASDLTISDYMSSDKNHSFKCTAYNTVNGVTKQASLTVTFTVTSEVYLFYYKLMTSVLPLSLV